MAEADPPGRKLGYLESRFYTLENPNSMWFIGNIQTSDALKNEDVIAACKILVRKQEALQMRITETPSMDGRKTDVCFELSNNPEGIYFESLGVTNEDSWSDIMMQYKDKQWDLTNGPFLRVFLVRIENESKDSHKESDKEIVESSDTQKFPFEYLFLFQMHHIIGDGVSLLDLVTKQFYPILSAVIMGEDAENRMPFIPHVDAVEKFVLKSGQLKNPVPWYMKLLVNAYRKINRNSKDKVTPMCKFKDETFPPVDEPDKDSHFMGTTYNREFTDCVIRAAKRHTVSVHSVLLLANALAFCRTALVAGVKIPKIFKQMWSVSLRNYTKFKSPEPLGLLVSACLTGHKRMSNCTMKAFWETCSNLTREISTETGKRRVRLSLMGVKYILDSTKPENLIKVGREFANPLLYLSNIGNQKHMYGDDCLQEIKTRGGPSTSDGIPINVTVGTFAGKFEFIFVRSQTTSIRFMETHIHELKCVLKEYCQEK